MTPTIQLSAKRYILHPIKRTFAKYYLVILRKLFGLKVIGITGSAGKTTAKEMLASILKFGGPTVYSYANIDPVYNIPTTILRCNPDTKYLILEMGIEYPREMDLYLWLVKLDIGVITNIYPAHTLNFKNEEGIFKEKSKLIKNLEKGDFAVLNSESLFLRTLKDIEAQIIWFGDKSNVRSESIKYSKNFKTSFDLVIDGEKIGVKLPILGKQFVENALAAASVAHVLGLSLEKIKRGLEKFKPQEHRMRIKRLKCGAILIDDSYNNNPEAAKLSVQLLRDIAGQRKTVLAFGDMLELGDREIEHHKAIGRYVKKVGIDKVVGIGKLSKHVSKTFVDSWENAIPLVESWITKKSVTLIKGSRAMNLDKLVKRVMYNSYYR